MDNLRQTQEEILQGYDVARFTSTIRPSLLCQICRKVLRSPISCLCTDKPATFCASCVLPNLENDPNCPVHKLLLRYNSPHPLVIEQLDDLQINCRNALRCSEIISLSEEQKHYDICPFTYVPCIHENCPSFSLSLSRIERQHSDAHNKECQYRIVVCKYRCGKSMQFRFQEHHQTMSLKALNLEYGLSSSETKHEQLESDKFFDENESKEAQSSESIEAISVGPVFLCVNRPIKCFDCEQKMYVKFLKAHRSEECMKQLVKCEICHQKVRRELMDEHFQKNLMKHSLLSLMSIRQDMNMSIYRASPNPSEYFLKANQILWEFERFDPNETVISPKFVIPNSYSFKLSISIKKDKVRIAFILCPGPFDDSLVWPFRHRIKFHLIDQTIQNSYFGITIDPVSIVKDREYFDKIIRPTTENEDKDAGYGFKVISLDDFNNKCLTIDKRYQMEAIIENQLCLLPYNQITYTLKNIENILSGKSISTQKFVCDKGYCFRLKFRPSMENLTIYVQLVPGEHDEHQLWPCEGQIELKIYNVFTADYEILEEKAREFIQIESEDAKYEQFIFEISDFANQLKNVDGIMFENTIQFQCQIKI